MLKSNILEVARKLKNAKKLSPGWVGLAGLGWAGLGWLGLAGSPVWAGLTGLAGLAGLPGLGWLGWPRHEIDILK